MIYVISKATFGSYNVRDIQCNANWCSCPYSDYALIPDGLVEGVLATKGYCDIVLNDDGTEVVSFTAREIPTIPEECHGTNTVLSVNGVNADTNGAVTLTPTNVGAAPAGYGLGETNPRVIHSLDEVNSPGWYKMWFSQDDTPAGASNGTWCFRVENFYDADNFNIIRWTYMLGSDTNMFTLRRVKRIGVWQEWEWINPPTGLGVEYRTTERYNGHPVCTMLTNCGLLGSSNTNVDTTIPVGATVLRHTETFQNLSMPFYYSNGKTNLHCQYNNSPNGFKVIEMFGHPDFADRPVVSQAWYVK